jgi:hypothetical protein
MYIKIISTDGTERKEYAEEFPRVRDGLLIIPKGRYETSLYVNMQTVREFTECER